MNEAAGTLRVRNSDRCGSEYVRGSFGTTALYIADPHRGELLGASVQPRDTPVGLGEKAAEPIEPATTVGKAHDTAPSSSQPLPFTTAAVVASMAYR